MFYFCFLQPSAASFAASIKFSIKMCHTQVSQLTAPKVLLRSWHPSCPRTVWACSLRDPLIHSPLLEKTHKDKSTSRLRELRQSSLRNELRKGANFADDPAEAQFNFNYQWEHCFHFPCNIQSTLIRLLLVRLFPPPSASLQHALLWHHAKI